MATAEKRRERTRSFGTAVGAVTITKHRHLTATALAAAVGVLLFVAPSAGAAVLHDQTDFVDPSWHILSQDFEVPDDPTGFYDASDSTAADDFTVPAGETWTIDGVEVLGYLSPDNLLPFPSSRVTLYRASGALPGAAILTTISNPADGGISPNFALPISGAPALAPGHYWVSVQAIGSYERWFWRQRTGQSGDPYVWENPGDSFDTGCTTFAPFRDCGLSPADSSAPDLAFKLSGIADDTGAPQTKITKGAPNKTDKTKFKFKFTSSEPDSTFECTLDKKNFKPCTSPKTVKRLDDGKHKFKVRAVDAAGNRDPSPAKDKFKVVD